MSIPAGFLQFIAANIQDGAGNKLAAGTIEWIPTDGKDVPIPAAAGGTGQPGQMTEGCAASYAVANGAVPGTAQIADTTQTLPQNISYRITVRNAQGAPILVRKGVQTIAGQPFNFDTYTPNVAPQAVIQYGPQGIQGPSGVVSGSQTAFAVTRAQAGNVFNPANATMDAVLSTAGVVIPIVNDPRFFVSDFITVPEGTNVVCNTAILAAASGYPPLGYCFYDITKTFISGAAGVAAGTPIPVPAGQNVAYIRFSCGTGRSDGSGVAATAFYLSSTLPTSISSLLGAVAIVNGDNDGNLVQGESIVRGQSINCVPADPYFSQVTTGIDANFWLTGYFPVVPGGSLICNLAMQATGYNNGLVFFDQNQTPLTGVKVAAATAVTVPPTAVWARASGYTGADVASSLVIVNGSTLPANYAYPGLSAYTSNKLLSLVGAKPLAGKRWLHFGDSISAIYGGGWLPQVLANTGMIQVGQDAQTGRATSGIFDMFNGPDGTYNPAASAGVQNVWSNGVSQWLWDPTKTLAQNLLAIAPDIVTIYLGTNDLTVTPGTPGDAVTAGTECGYVRAVLETILTTLPNVRILWVAPYTVSYGQTTTAGIVQAIKGTCALYGVPVLDLYAESGVCALTQAYYLLLDSGDGAYVHPNGNGCTMLARLVSNFLNQKF